MAINVEHIKSFAKANWHFWGASLLAHVGIVAALGLVLGVTKVAQELMDAPLFETEMETEIPEQQIEHFEVGDTPVEATELNTESLTMNEAPQIEQSEQFNDSSENFSEAGGGFASATGPSLGGAGGFDISAIGDGPSVAGKGGVGFSVGTANAAGSGGGGAGFGNRGEGSRHQAVGSGGGTKATDRAVAGALNWMARHQNPDGSWSLDEFSRHCKKTTCDGKGDVKSDTAGTAFALLPFFAAGQTHETKGPYQRTIFNGVNWLIKSQKPDGHLGGTMYEHGLASIALCEAYGLSKDNRVGPAAQKALAFIEAAQNPTSGGWHYAPRAVTPGDTSVVGWQMMALKSGQMAGLKVDPKVIEGGKKFLKSVSSGKAGGLFGYASPGATQTMTAVGLLCMQYSGSKRADPLMVEGMDYLMKNLPNKNNRNCYYWYYAVQVMHNLPGPEWDAWNRQSRKILIDSQEKDGCAAGSWSPERPIADAFGKQGGRIMVTAISALSLEVYYRYLPLYQMDSTAGLPGGGTGGTDAKK
jgi:hypothetical protein